MYYTKNIRKKFYFGIKQREMLASFFNNVAVGWFGAAFITPGLTQRFDWLIIVTYVVMMIVSLVVALTVLPKE